VQCQWLLCWTADHVRAGSVQTRRHAWHRCLGTVHAVPIRPKRHVPQQHGEGHHKHTPFGRCSFVERWIYQLGDASEVFPHAKRPLPCPRHNLPLPLRIAQERTEPTRVDVLRQQQQVLDIKFKVIRKLIDQLKNAIQKLRKNGRELPLVSSALLVLALAVTAPGVEGVSEGEEVLLDEGAEALEGSVVRVEEELGQRRDLAGAIPSVL